MVKIPFMADGRCAGRPWKKDEEKSSPASAGVHVETQVSHKKDENILLGYHTHSDAPVNLLKIKRCSKKPVVASAISIWSTHNYLTHI
jgi:hypothetical protein